LGANMGRSVDTDLPRRLGGGVASPWARLLMRLAPEQGRRPVSCGRRPVISGQQSRVPDRDTELAADTRELESRADASSGVLQRLLQELE